MDDAEYLATQSSVMLLAKAVDGLPLAEFVNRINRAETLGPILDPTLYMKAGDGLRAIKRMAEAALDFQKEARKLKAELEKRGTADS